MAKCQAVHKNNDNSTEKIMDHHQTTFDVYVKNVIKFNNIHVLLLCSEK